MEDIKYLSLTDWALEQLDLCIHLEAKGLEFEHMLNKAAFEADLAVRFKEQNKKVLYTTICVK